MNRSLRIGLVCPYSFDTPGGVQNHVLGLASYLSRRGHHPHILAPGELAHQTADRFGLDHDQFTTAGMAVPVPYNGSIARVNFGPLSAARVRRWLAAGEFDLVHIHEPITPSVAMLALWAAEVPVVATFHTATPRSRSMQLARSALRPAIEKIDAGIAVSETARMVVVQHLGRDAVVIPNGFSHQEFAALPTRGSRPRIAFLGRLNEPRKGLEVLLAAIPMLLAAIPDLDIVIAGQGERELPAGCRSLGVVSDQQRAEMLRSADVFVAPHLFRESFGIVLIEAMASGAVVVASDLPAFADLVEPESQPPLGFSFAAGDADALARTIIDVLGRDNSGLLDRARQASSQFDWSSVGARIVGVYEATIAASGTQAKAAGER